MPLALAEQQFGDDETRHRHEHVDAEEARRQHARREVVHDHGHDRERAHAVERAVAAAAVDLTETSLLELTPAVAFPQESRCGTR